MTRIALFAGAFDPPTLGHMDIINRASHVCDQLIVAVAENHSKQALFSVEERRAMLQEAAASYPYVEVVSFAGLTVDFAKKRKALFLLRGIRSAADLDYESEMAAANRQMSGIETLLLFGLSPHISSSLVREIAHFGGPLEGFVPPKVEALLKSKFTARK